MTPSSSTALQPHELKVPDFVILDTREKVKPLLKAIQTIPGLTWEDTDVIQTVLQAIQYENTALKDLHERCMRIVGQATGLGAYEFRVLSTKSAMPVGMDLPAHDLFRRQAAMVQGVSGNVSWFNETQQLTTLLTELGAYVYAQLRMLGCYTNGYLFYQFKDWIGTDMLLVRFEVDTSTLEPESVRVTHF